MFSKQALLSVVNFEVAGRRSRGHRLGNTEFNPGVKIYFRAATEVSLALLTQIHHQRPNENTSRIFSDKKSFTSIK